MSDSRHRSRVANQPKQGRPIPWEMRTKGDRDDIDALADVFAWFGSIPLPHRPSPPTRFPPVHLVPPSGAIYCQPQAGCDKITML